MLLFACSSGRHALGMGGGTDRVIHWVGEDACHRVNACWEGGENGVVQRLGRWEKKLAIWDDLRGTNGMMHRVGI